MPVRTHSEMLAYAIRCIEGDQIPADTWHRVEVVDGREFHWCVRHWAAHEGCPDDFNLVACPECGRDELVNDVSTDRDPRCMRCFSRALRSSMAEAFVTGRAS